ncbi:MAG: 3-dehydroquinate synthase [Lachnospiraceae bacterium]|jgi:3-dehydroquinate synthase|nr:3-dehydroquinate synthase [Lachnospiraceae bacterium]
MEKIAVKVRQHIADYNIVLDSSFAALTAELAVLFPASSSSRKVIIVTDTNVLLFYADEIDTICAAAGIKTARFVFAAGEESKKMTTVADLYQKMSDFRLSRDDLLLALGGGVCGDICGFAAATYLRGIAYVYLPTSLLAQVDAGIGGKTAVDFGSHKNMVGAFHMPRLVYINTQTLTSLPEREYLSGFAEVMKHALIRSASFYEWLIANSEEICSRDSETLTEMIRQSILIKKSFVEKDPYELTGERTKLNFGHTLGHALEKATACRLLHGECVALGIVAAAYISRQKGHITADEYYEIRDMFVLFQLPISLTAADFNPKQVLANTKTDKKTVAETMNFVLLSKVGKVFLDQTVTDEDILEAMAEITWKEED